MGVRSILCLRKEMAAICADLVPLILIHLPVKSLIRFKSVSKEWCSLISSPCFIKLHRDNHQSDKRYLVAHNWENPDCFERRVLDTNLTLTTKFFLPKQLMNRKTYYNSIEVVGSCRGLVVLILYLMNKSCTLNDDGQLVESNIIFIMCNPSINSYMVFPTVDLSDPDHDRRLDFRATACGFGYDKSTDDYKLVVFGHDKYMSVDYGKNEIYCQRVYSAKRNSWGPPRLVETGLMSSYHRPGVVDDHIFYWPFLLRNRHKDNGVFLGFDICTEEWLKTELPLPDFGAHVDQRIINNLGVLDNNLCLLSYDDVNMDVWVMKEYGVKESWTKLASLPKFEKYVPSLIAYGDDGQLLFRHGDSYLWYDLKDKSLKSTGISSWSTTFTPCTETLVPVPVSVTAMFQAGIHQVRPPWKMENEEGSIVSVDDFQD